MILQSFSMEFKLEELVGQSIEFCIMISEPFPNVFGGVRRSIIWLEDKSFFTAKRLCI